MTSIPLCRDFDDLHQDSASTQFCVGLNIQARPWPGHAAIPRLEKRALATAARPTRRDVIHLKWAGLAKPTGGRPIPSHNPDLPRPPTPSSHWSGRRSVVCRVCVIRVCIASSSATVCRGDRLAFVKWSWVRRGTLDILFNGNLKIISLFLTLAILNLPWTLKSLIATMSLCFSST